jgi:hypothetical protein
MPSHDLSRSGYVSVKGVHSSKEVIDYGDYVQVKTSHTYVEQTVHRQAPDSSRRQPPTQNALFDRLNASMHEAPRTSRQPERRGSVSSAMGQLAIQDRDGSRHESTVRPSRRDSVVEPSRHDGTVRPPPRNESRTRHSSHYKPAESHHTVKPSRRDSVSTARPVYSTARQLPAPETRSSRAPEASRAPSAHPSAAPQMSRRQSVSYHQPTRVLEPTVVEHTRRDAPPQMSRRPSLSHHQQPRVIEPTVELVRRGTRLEIEREPSHSGTRGRSATVVREARPSRAASYREPSVI